MFDKDLYDKRVAELVAEGRDEREARQIATFEQTGGDAKVLEPTEDQETEAV